MKNHKLIALIFVALFANKAIAQFDITPNDWNVYWGDLEETVYYEFTFTIKSYAHNDTDFEVYSDMDLSYWAPWLTIEPTSFTLDYAQEQIVTFKGTYEEWHSYGDKHITITFEEYGQQNTWHNTTIHWTSHPPSGIEDYLEWIDFTEIFSEFETISYSMYYVDNPPYNGPIEWNLEMKLLARDGEYLYYEEYIPNDEPATWEFEAPELPDNIPFYRTLNGEIQGIVYMTAIDINGYENFAQKSFKIRKEPSKPAYSVLNTDIDKIKLLFQNFKTGATSYEIYYDTDSNQPFSGTGLDQGDSPILTDNIYSFHLSGLDECTHYYFAIKAINSYGESELSEVKKIVVFNTPNSLPIFYNHDDVTIEANKSVIEDNYINYYFGDLIIEEGASVTFEDGTIYFDEVSSLIIKPTGELTLDGTTCTAPCDHPWQGIQVHGNKQQSQWPDQYGVMHQGMLELKNGAVIENAIDAVVLWNPGSYSSTGGIVQANDAVFRNNKKSVHALMYWNFDPYNPEQRLDNRSYFKNTTFELTEDYHGEEKFHKHVDLFDVFGIDFRACTFTLHPEAENVSGSNHGIAAYSAGFSLLPVCSDPNTMPCPGYIENTFNGFNWGVSASDALTFSPPFFATRADFSNNSHGLHVNGVKNFTVINSTFNAGKEDYKGECKSGLGVGIYTNESTGFAIQENNFTKYTAAPQGDYFGTWINNTLEADEVYKNDFSGLSYANYSEGKNWREDDRYIGLAYFCNENQSNYADFYVGRNSLNEGGIQSKQGDLNHDAGNTFTQSGATWHFYNDGEHLVGYYHNNSQANKIPDLNLLHEVLPYAITYNNSCPSYYGGGDDEKPMAMSTAEQQQAEQFFIANLTDYNNVRALYTSLMDGGDTDGTVFDIKTAHPDDMWALRAQLLGKSPHLSMEVLKEASDRTDVFNDAALFDILAANPDELKKDELINYLEQKEEPLPDYMVNILKQVAEGATYKTVLEQQMAHYNRNKTRAAHNMIRHIVHDSIVDNNLLRQWLNNLGGIQSDKQIIGTFVQEGNYANALALANMLPQLYNLQNDELIAHNDYMAMLNLQHTLQQQGRNLFQLTGAEKQQLDQLATGKGTAALQARAILEMVYNEYSEPCPCVDESGSFKNMGINLQGPATANLLEVTARPNPAKDWVVFEFRLPSESPEAAIRISDAGGKLIETLPITGTQGQKMWDTRGLEPGTYYYTLIKAGEYKSGRIVIHR